MSKPWARSVNESRHTTGALSGAQHHDAITANLIMLTLVFLLMATKIHPDVSDWDMRTSRGQKSFNKGFMVCVSHF